MLNNLRFYVPLTKIKLTESFATMYVKVFTKMILNLNTLMIFNTKINQTTVICYRARVI